MSDYHQVRDSEEGVRAPTRAASESRSLTGALSVRDCVTNGFSLAQMGITFIVTFLLTFLIVYFGEPGMLW